ncbi:hypothetical protein [Inquilinus sp. Marseille-Q2685]|uniref:hypothetical protein n=1 Tax=Inquilinus sp. Marseille-Q2685 TaxID=2866581 RepID=UPI001CE433A9|nr:hypothetical protein [Inquilinus sp. Marseille-Q2685]
MTAAEQPGEDTTLVPTDSGERRWRRLSLGALLVAVPVPFVLSARGDLEEWWQGQELFEQPVPAGSETRFAGADWRLETVEVLPLKQSGWPRRQGQGTPVRVRFAVTVRDPGIDVLWRRCRASLQDDQGRRWSAGSFGGPRSTEGTMTCGAATLEPRAPGTVLRIEQDFTVPHDLAGAVEPTVSMDGERPSYLRFRRGG